MSRINVLKRVVVATAWFALQLVIIPVLLLLGIVVASINLFNVILFGKNALFMRSFHVRTRRWTRELWDWNADNLHRSVVGPLSSFDPVPPMP